MDKQIELNALADEYGILKAQAANLKKRQGEIQGIFQNAGVHELEGDLFRCVGSDIPDSTGTDWEKIARALHASDRMIEHPANQKITRGSHYRLSVYGITGVVA